MTDVAAASGGSRGHVLQTGLFVVMEAAWIAALALFLDAAIAAPATAPLALVCLLYPLALVAGTAIDRASARWWSFVGLHGAAFGVAIAVLVAVAVPPGSRLWGVGDWPFAWAAYDPAGQRMLALAGLALFCWARGAMLVGRRLSAFSVALGFQIGLVVLMSIFAISAASGATWPHGAELTFAFVAAGLLALWHVRASASARREGGGGRRDPAAAAVGLVFVAVLGLALAAAFDRGVLEAAVAFATLVWERVVAFVLYLFSLLPEAQRPGLVLQEPPRRPQLNMPREPEPRFSPPEMLRMIFAFVFFGIVTLVTAVILFANLRNLLAWLRGRRERTPGLDYDRSRHGVGDTLAALWAAVVRFVAAIPGWLARRLAWKRAARPSGLPLRRAYAGLERKLDTRGWPRRPWETPFEYARRMAAEWPRPGGDLMTLTAAYVNARYGEARPLSRYRLGRLMKKVGRSMKKVREKQFDADDAGRTGA